MFSIVIPVHEKPHTIRGTIESALAQTDGEFELILVGEPDDSSMAVARRIDDPRIRIVEQSNLGAGAARNAGIEASRHDWIAFLDADDLWLPDHLAELSRIRALHPDCGLIGTAFVLSDSEDRFDPLSRAGRVVERICYFEEFLRRPYVLCSSSAAIHRRAYSRLGGFGDAPLGEDSEYWARIALDFPVAVSDRVTAIYVRGTGGMMDSSKNRWAASALASPADICPSVGLVVDRYPRLESASLRRATRLYVRRHFDWALRTSARAGDFKTIRRIARIYWGRPTAKHAALIAVAHLPRPLANAVLRLVLGLRLFLPGVAKRRRR